MSVTVEERLRMYTTKLDKAVDDYSATSARDLLEPTRVQARGFRRRRPQLVGAALAVGIALFGAWWVRGSNSDVVISTNSTTATPPPSVASVTLPDLVGLDHTSFTTLLQALRLRATVTKKHSQTVPTGQVIEQEPSAGATVRSGSVVRVVESIGPASSFDLLGGAPVHIRFDHVGDYVWTSRAVIPHLPDTFGTSYKVVGTADVLRERDTLIAVPGGYALQVSFTVVSYSPGASLSIPESTAQGTPHLIVPGSPTTS
jgi:hypothetical protein